MPSASWQPVPKAGHQAGSQQEEIPAAEQSMGQGRSSDAGFGHPIAAAIGLGGAGLLLYGLLSAGSAQPKRSCLRTGACQAQLQLIPASNTTRSPVPRGSGSWPTSRSNTKEGLELVPHIFAQQGNSEIEGYFTSYD